MDPTKTSRFKTKKLIPDDPDLSIRKGLSLHFYSKDGIETFIPIRSGGLWIFRDLHLSQIKKPNVGTYSSPMVHLGIFDWKGSFGDDFCPYTSRRIAPLGLLLEVFFLGVQSYRFSVSVKPWMSSGFSGFQSDHLNFSDGVNPYDRVSMEVSIDR